MSAVSKAVFLSYASQDAAAAKRICEALRAAGVEVWLDQDGGLVGGDAWDVKIRGQIASCALFMPIISANTQARLEGYFRLEWKLSAQRTHTMADEKAFLLPVVIDHTRDADARVPSEFKSVQWTRLPNGETSATFCARVRVLLEGEDGARTHPSAVPNPGRQRLNEPTRPTNRRRATPVFALAAMVIAGAAVAVWQPWRSPEKITSEPAVVHATAPTVTQPEPKSIAVLAFANMSADKEATEYFSDGISDEILNALDRNPALRVTPRTSSFSFKGRNVPLDEIGRTLRVANVIEGSVKKAGNEVRITVKLLNAASGTRVWSEEFVRQLTTSDIFAVQSEIAAKVAAKLGGVAIAPSASVSVPAGAQTNNIAAHDLYLRGRALQMAPQTATTQLEIIKLYEKAVGEDPGYALAWARMSEGFVLVFASAFDRSRENAANATTAATTALRLAPHLPEAQLAVARVRLVIDRDHDATRRMLDELARGAPYNAEAILLRAELERASGNWGDTFVRLCAQAVELDPQNARSIDRVAGLLNTPGKFADADRLSRRAWELSQTSVPAIRRRARILIAWTGDVRGALEILDSTPSEMRGTLFLQDRAWVLEMLGDMSAAKAELEQIKRELANASWTRTSGPRSGLVVANYLIARLEAKSGEQGRAAEHLDEALRIGRLFAADFPDLDTGPSNLSLIHAARGERDAALSAIADAMALVNRTRDAHLIALRRQTKAEALALLGEKEPAIAELRAVHEMGYGLGYTLRLDPDWSPLRGEPNFQQLMREAEARADAQPRPK